MPDQQLAHGWPRLVLLQSRREDLKDWEAFCLMCQPRYLHDCRSMRQHPRALIDLSHRSNTSRKTAIATVCGPGKRFTHQQLGVGCAGKSMARFNRPGAFEAHSRFLSIKNAVSSWIQIGHQHGRMAKLYTYWTWLRGLERSSKNLSIFISG